MAKMWMNLFTPTSRLHKMSLMSSLLEWFCLTLFYKENRSVWASGFIRRCCNALMAKVGECTFPISWQCYAKGRWFLCHLPCNLGDQRGVCSKIASTIISLTFSGSRWRTKTNTERRRWTSHHRPRGREKSNPSLSVWLTCQIWNESYDGCKRCPRWELITHRGMAFVRLTLHQISMRLFNISMTPRAETKKMTREIVRRMSLFEHPITRRCFN